MAASRAARVATLLPDPGNAEERKEIYRRLAGDVIETIEQKKVGGRTVEKTKRENLWRYSSLGTRYSNPDLDWFRKKIHTAYGGRAPKVLDPFAGGGAIPLEAMRLGCDVTAIDIKTHTLVTLRHLVHDPASLPSCLRFNSSSPISALHCRSTRVVALWLRQARCEKGIEVRGPAARCVG